MTKTNNNNEKKSLNVPPLRFPGFKGEWVKTRLKDICSEFSYGLNSPSMEFDGVHKYIRITDIDEQTSQFNESHLSSPKCFDDAFKLNKGDLLFARTGASVGKTYLYKPEDGDLYFAGFLIRTNVTNANPDFVFQSTKTKSYKNWVKIMSARSGQPGINAEEYKNYQLFVPSIEEQKKIGNFLNIIDKRIDVQRKTIEELESFKAALSSTFISEADEKESIASLIESGLLREVKPSELKPFSGNRIYLSTSCIDGKSIISTKGPISYSFRPSRACMSPIKDSVWFAKMKNSVKVFRAQAGDSDRYVLSSGFAGLLSTTPLIDPNWLEMIFLSSEFNKQKNQMSEGGTMSGVKSGSFDELYIPYYSSTTSEQSCLVAWDKAKAIVDVESRKLVGLMKLREYCLTNLFA